MRTIPPTKIAGALPAEHRSGLMSVARDAATVRTLMVTDPAFGSAMGQWVAQVLAHRLHAARVRLLDLYAPHGSGSYL
ncbi:hypothetical protein [Streptomyces sp. XY332]|uniref:hypothetical protein n=1 Tax=Streptomyces sp. XY332 TaxID=1415561 RepID=UPI0006B15E15